VRQTHPGAGRSLGRTQELLREYRGAAAGRLPGLRARAGGHERGRSNRHVGRV